MKPSGVGVVFFSLFLLFGALMGQQTGEIRGRVTDEKGEALPGVSITARSPSLQGLRATVSDKSGDFRLHLLPVGNYALTFELPAFEKLTMTGNAVRLGFTSTLSVVLTPATVAEEVTVVAPNPLVDATSVDTSYRLNSRDLAFAPTQSRTIADIVNLAPGVTGVRTNTVTGGANANWIADLTTEAGLPSFRGEGNASNNWFVDGLSSKGCSFGDPGVRVNYDAWEEVQIVSDGFAPGMGQGMGSFVNIVTKSGGNAFHGQLGALLQPSALRAAREPGQLATVWAPESSLQQYYADLGGPIIKDKLWFFVSDNLFARSDQTKEQTIGWLMVPAGERRTSTNNGFGKITLTPRENHTLSLSGTVDTSLRQTGGIGFPETFAHTSYDRYSYRLNYRGILSRNTILTAAWGRNRNATRILPLSGDYGPAAYYYQDIGQMTHGLNFSTRTLERRSDLAVDLTQLLDLGRFGNHEIKAGMSAYSFSNEEHWRWSGLDADRWIGNGFDNGVGIAWRNQTTPALLWENAPGDAKNRTRGFGFYAEDNIVHGPFSLMLGLRTDTQQVFDDVGTKVWSWGPGDFLQPRATLAWDLTRDGRNVLKFGYGRYAMPMLASSLPFINTVHLFIHRFYLWIGPSNPTDAQLGDSINWYWLWDQSGPRGVDPALKPNKADRFLLEYDRQLGTNWALKIRGISSKSGDLIDNITVYDDAAPRDIKYLLTNFELKRRSYRGLEVEVNGRIRDRLALNASWTWSRAKGTVPGDFFEPIGWEIYAGGYYDNTLFGYRPLMPAESPWKAYYDLLFEGLGGRGIGDDSWYGILPSSVDHVVKLSGTYFAPFGISVSTAMEYLSGYHWEMKGLSTTGFYARFPEGRGVRTTPPHASVDLVVERDFRLRRGLVLGCGVSAYNLLNSQRPVSYFKSDTPNFGRVWARQLPRWVQLKLRLMF